jgi:hypothetical protein
MTNIRGRLDKLEEATKPGVVIVWCNHNETDDQAMARWKAEHPGEDLARADARVIVFGWDYPQPEAAA